MYRGAIVINWNYGLRVTGNCQNLGFSVNGQYKFSTVTSISEGSICMATYSSTRIFMISFSTKRKCFMIYGKNRL